MGGSAKYGRMVSSAIKGGALAAAAGKGGGSKSSSKRVKKAKKKGKSKGQKKVTNYFRPKVSANYSRNRSQTIAEGTSQHNNLASRSFSHTFRRGRPFSKKCVYKYNVTWDAVYSLGEGLQSTNYLKAIGTRQMLSGITSNLRQIATQDAVNYYDLNPYKNITGSTLFTAGATPTAEDKLYYRSISGRLSVINLESISQRVEVLWFLCKKDTNDDPSTTWAQVMESQRLGTAAAAPTLLATSATATPGYAAPSTPGTHPMQFKAFREFWKCIRSEKLHIQPGDQTDINFYFRYNKHIDKVVIDRKQSTFLAGYSIVPIYIVTGGLIGVFDAGATSTEVTHGPTKIGIHIQQQHTFQALPAPARLPVSQFFPGAVVGLHSTTARYVEDTDKLAVGVVIA